MNERNLHTLKHFTGLSAYRKKEFLSSCPAKFIKFLCECVLNVLEGNVPVSVKKIQKYEKEIRQLSNRSSSNTVRRRTLSLPSGLRLIETLTEPVCRYFDQ